MGSCRRILAVVAAVDVETGREAVATGMAAAAEQQETGEQVAEAEATAMAEVATETAAEAVGVAAASCVARSHRSQCLKHRHSTHCPHCRHRKRHQH